ncbi:SDR family NAD(P)-dependent oxidoreductase [Parachitinimonas caeni]|uniref:SDR family NAD(P)-dependent oxidoreductase n=1 Tax=Parachitinimonas caeni TaxID=3031301 RepID=A0ABT7DXD4_9NEIS|nr:SDR family NAD(P)-dependent oxidoreductase [Parachitinimonas caeni]MDK2124728.1 SDR family NAD(P)-dependent oxidoreductase [Parachitinimonas caeni]
MWFRSLNPKLTDWRGRRVWIVGSSTGIGAALAQHLGRQGARLALSARNRDALLYTARALPDALILPMDVSIAGHWHATHRQIIEQWSQLDMVVFCAASYQQERSWQVEGCSARQTIEVNLTSIYYGLEVILPTLLAQQSGSLVLIASVAGYMGLPNASVYGPTKAALINLAELLYADLHPKGLGIYLVNPGFVRTPLTARNQFHMPALQTPEQAASAIVQGLAQGRFEIDFPKRFTRPMKWASLLPYRWRFALMNQLLHLT